MPDSLPPGWVKTTIGAICQFAGGGTPSKDQPDYWNGNIPWASVKDVKGMFILGTQDYITEQGLKNSASQLAKAGELIIVTRISPGESAITTTDLAINQDLKIVKPLYPAQSAFLHYLFKAYKEKIVKQARGTTVLGIRLNELNSLSINLPPLNEQRRIADKIDALFADIDQGIEAIKLAQRQLKTYRQSILKYAFEGKLTEQWREAHIDELEDVDTLLAKIKTEQDAKNERKNKDPHLLTEEELTELPEIPEYWKWARVTVIGEVKLGRQRSPQKKANLYPTKYIRAANITDTGIDAHDILEMEFEPEEFKRYELKKGDLLLSEASGSADKVGKPAIWNNEIPNCCFQNTVIRVRPYLPFNVYLLWAFKANYKNKTFAKLSGGVGINHLSARKLSELPIPLCSLAEQQEIVREIEARFTEIDQLEKTLQASLQQAESLRQSILKAAFAGRLVEQDPADETAEVLLNVIKCKNS